ncbi:MAG: prepilin-type N-terminal cleavage/methylation domain-containing protein [Gammaproteobacteria bacterium]|nr:prepilin-type N-terminal cleavage/methylation domain-containing protein [Gammaproteobacteria bacterium]MBU1978946.1 prepilin-type N-terminal cleavage/methylation domain-containing protein [Gammaproteobacteria bacterium]
MKSYLHKSSGFTLVEMAIVLVIVGLLLGGLLMPLAAQVEQRRIGETQKALEEIKEALIGFAIANGRLPCPASATIQTGATGAGLEPAPFVAAGCTNVAGALPWATLGVNETDAWGKRYTYRVTREFTRTIPQITFASCAVPPPSNPTLAAFALCSQGDMTLLSTGGGSILSSTVPVVVISHGKNGNGAYYPQGTQLPLGTDVDEQDNQLITAGTATANANFVSKTPTATFDDIVIWLSPNILFNRMVTAGKLP